MSDKLVIDNLGKIEAQVKVFIVELLELRRLRDRCERTHGDPLELALCEQNSLVLKPDKLYIFTTHPDCAECKRLALIGRTDNDGHLLKGQVI